MKSQKSVLLTLEELEKFFDDVFNRNIESWWNYPAFRKKKTDFEFCDDIKIITFKKWLDTHSPSEIYPKVTISKSREYTVEKISFVIRFENYKDCLMFKLMNG